MKSSYENFRAAIYATVYDVRQMSDLNWLRAQFDVLSRYIKVSKVYLETHRDLAMVDESVIVGARRFFEERDVGVAGGITVTVNERERFKTYCYTDPAQRQKLKDVVAFTARLFDEIILDDFFFTNCKCPSCIQAKGQQSWTRFRLDLMAEAAQSLVLDTAHAANPKVKVVIKYPNWYEHFQGLGFNLKVEPLLFDGIYTGNETRDPVMSEQHLQPYQGYLIFRYFENVKPGGNRGGWVDPFGYQYLDRYVEQLWLTLFAQAPEITLFHFGSIQRLIQDEQRAPWQGKGTSFDYDQVTASVRRADGSLSDGATVALAAGAAFEQVDQFIGELGKPLGVKSYKPYHSHGEDFLHNYLGMLGIPLDLTPEFPVAAQTIFLTEAASFDLEIVAKIKHQLMDGKVVIITSGLLRALQGHGIEDIVELRYTDRKLSVDQFHIGWGRVYSSACPITVPQINYLTNDSWEEVSCVAGVVGGPLLHSAEYANSKLYILTIPDHFGDLYHLPPEVLTRIKETFMAELPVRVDGPSQVALFVYDNDTFIIESFLPESVEVGVVMDERYDTIHDILSGEVITGIHLENWRGQKIGKKKCALQVKPHSYRAFRLCSQGAMVL